MLAFVALLLMLAAARGGVSVGVTYMTGALVRCGQGLATALSGGDFSHAAIGTAGLWLAAGYAALLSLFAFLLGPARAG